MAGRGRYYIDSSGSRCRDSRTGKYAKCDLCPKCMVKRDAVRRRKARVKRARYAR